MVGIKSYGVHVPLWRLDLQSVQGGWQGERAIANFDEDSLTMGVAAGVNCLRHIDRNTVDGLFFASSTFPYREKQASVTVATVAVGAADGDARSGRISYTKPITLASVL